jgi:hypothetical protein
VADTVPQYRFMANGAVLQRAVKPSVRFERGLYRGFSRHQGA